MHSEYKKFKFVYCLQYSSAVTTYCERLTDSLRIFEI